MGRRAIELSDKQRARVAELLVEGRPNREIAAVIGCCGGNGQPQKVCDREGLGELYRARTSAQVSRSVARLRGADIMRMSLEGKTLAEIGDEVGVTRERVRQILDRGGCAPVRKKKRSVRLAEKKAQRGAAQMAAWRTSPRGALYGEFARELRLRGYDVRFEQVRCSNGMPSSVRVYVNGVRARLRVCMEKGLARSGGKQKYLHVPVNLKDVVYLVVLKTGYRYAYWSDDLLVTSLYFREGGEAIHEARESWVGPPLGAN